MFKSIGTEFLEDMRRIMGLAKHGLFEAEHGLFEAEHVGGYRRGIEAS